MKLNRKANQIRNLNFSENKKEDIGMKQEMVDVLKEKTGYKKDVDASKSKRERRAKIQELAGNDPGKIARIKETLNNPFPNDFDYENVWKDLTPEQQDYMKENIRITEDGKIEMIKMRKKFSVLTAKHNQKDIVEGSDWDTRGKKGMKGVTYFTGHAAERECEKQGKKLLKDAAEVKQFIDFFPGETTKEKIWNFVKLFGLKISKAGYLDPDSGEWEFVNEVGHITLSKVNGSTVYGVEWPKIMDILPFFQEFLGPYITYEDC